MSGTRVNPDAERLAAEFDLLRELGLRYLFPVGANKRPVGLWAKGPVNYVQSPARDGDRDRWSRDPQTQGWCVLCGNRDARVFVLDVEPEGMGEPLIRQALSWLPDSCKRPSPSGGEHAVIVVVDGPAVPTELLAVDYVDDEPVLLAETRGVSKNEGANGAYAVITGPGRGPLPPGFAPHHMTRAQADALLEHVRAADRRPLRGRRRTSGRSAGPAFSLPLEGCEAARVRSWWEMSPTQMAEEMASTARLRNVTLHEMAFNLGLRLELTAEAQDMLRNAAESAGLASQAASETIASAGRGAAARWRPFQEALCRLESSIPDARKRRGLLSTAHALAQVAIRAQSPEVGPGVRRLAEQTPVTPATITRHLRDLVTLGFLQPVSAAKGPDAAVYRIIIDPDSDPLCNTYPAAKDQVLHDGSPGFLARTGQLLKHSAYLRMRNGPALPPISAGILARLEDGPMVQRELRASLGCSRSSLYRNLRALESAELIERRDQVIALKGSDVLSQVQDWAVFKGVDGRARERHRAHQEQRASFRVWHEALEERRRLESEVGLGPRPPRQRPRRRIGVRDVPKGGAAS